MMKNINLEKAAYVVIDIQEGIIKNGSFEPHTAKQVLTVTNTLTEHFKNTKSLITLVNVDATTFHYLHPARFARNQEIHVPIEYMEFSTNIANDSSAENVLEVTKHSPSAFFGTDLDLQLRRRGIDTIILSGVISSNGVYATALDAFQHGYHLYIVEDAITDRDKELHNIFVNKLYPKLGTVVTSSEVLKVER